MQSLSLRKFVRQYDLDLIIASHEEISVGDMVWDAVGITPPKFDHPGAPTNVFNALEIVGQIDEPGRKALQNQAANLPFLRGGLADIDIHLDAEHSGDFRYPALVAVASKISVAKISSFNFSKIQVRKMPNDMRMFTDRCLEGIKRSKWEDYDMSIRRSFIITELFYGAVSVSLDTKIANQADVEVLTNAGFVLKTRDAISRTEVYSMSVNGVPFAMRTERARRFAA